MLRDSVALFGAGVASFLAPCIVPLLPAYLAVIAGEGGARDGDAEANPATSVRATLVFVAGFALVFAVFGAVAGLIGSSLDRAQGVVQRVGGVLVVVMGLALLGVLRGPFLRERRLFGEGRWKWARGPLRPFVLGVAFGAAWTPCVGPLLGAALTFAAVSGEAGRGSLLLLAYAVGIGVPFVLASLGLASSPRVAAGLRRIGPPLQRIGGAAMVVLGVLLVTGAYAHLTSYLARFSPSVAGL